MAYGGFKDLVRRAASDKVLCDKAFNIAKIPKYDRYKEVLLLCFINFLTKSPLHLQINVVVSKMNLNKMNN